MSDSRDLSCVLYHHQWTTVEEWVRCLGVLATLSDGEIVALVKPVADSRSR